ncbi:MAG: sensor histidine kinase [Actinomycetota bacterium]
MLSALCNPPDVDLDDRVRRMLRPLSIVLVIIYGVPFAIIDYFHTQRANRGAIAIYAAITFVGVLAILILVRVLKSPRATHPLALSMVALATFNGVGHLVVGVRPDQIQLLSLLAIGAGFLLLRTWWYFGALAITASGFFVVILIRADLYSSATRSFWQQVFFSSIGVGLLLHFAQKELQIRLERDRNRIQTLQRANATFVSGITHDLRSPLTSIVGFADLLVNGDERMDESTQRELIDRIRRNGLVLNELIDVFLEYSRLETDSMQIDKEELSVSSVVSEYLRTRAPIFEGRSIISIVPDDLRVYADERAFARVLGNLVENASKYSCSDTTVLIRAIKENDGWVTVSVTDSGCGISAEDLERLFAPFVQVGTAGHHNGVGMGLATAKRLVELHGGRIWANSSAGSGSTFFFALPSQDHHGGNERPDSALDSHIRLESKHG